MERNGARAVPHGPRPPPIPRPVRQWVPTHRPRPRGGKYPNTQRTPSTCAGRRCTFSREFDDAYVDEVTIIILLQSWSGVIFLLPNAVSAKKNGMFEDGVAPPLADHFSSTFCTGVTISRNFM